VWNILCAQKGRYVRLTITVYFLQNWLCACGEWTQAHRLEEEQILDSCLKRLAIKGDKVTYKHDKLA
jgi:hypothetical protein